MKLTRYKKWLVLALALANGFFAAAQSSGVPGPTNYSSFSRFITERNIFNPSRFSHSSTTRVRRRVSPSTPAFSLVGTMSYEKGMFAFFDGNNSDLRKVLYESDTNSVAGFTVAEITPASVKLQSADKKETVQLEIGKTMRQEGGHWKLDERGEMSASASTAESAAPGTEGSSSEAASTPN